MNTTARRLSTGAAALAAVSLLLAGCASAPASSGTTAAAGSAAPSVTAGFLPCIVSDSGGFDDKSFNALGLQGVTDAAAALGVKYVKVQSEGESDYQPNMDSLVAQGCTTIVATGYLLADATKATATANPNVNFLMIDDTSITLPNVKSIVFDTSQSGYLVGYASASYSKSGIVATYGGAQIPPVTLYMDGFALGVAKYNADKSKSVKLLGWDFATQQGAFTGNFTDINAAKVLSQGFIEQGADLILPVGGPIYQGTVAAIRDSGKGEALLGVDTDMAVSDPTDADLFLTSIARDMPLSISSVIEKDASGTFDNTAFVGTLANKGVAISPFHDFESKVDPALQGEIDALQASIIDGSITIDSPSAP
ncbi:BMP family ABC transporter substrate-binding protein [Subtercola boreus]|uniref:BMP family ABC transporter substrate-binding protein n=1 Tax=Subtercola boreus TaxID=120213 RepID=A0A3E0VD71_9MICO|nr:BMP family ABC transporter substrate-binding protein [Subtercola boreus]RFA07691.1 BMP family ABC transporter substrate-binding protein [Subtercola boreus]